LGGILQKNWNQNLNQQKNKRSIGSETERFVCQWLEHRGYQIVAQNFRCRMGEIDIVARQGGYLVFIEVKYRSTPGSGTGEEAVNLRKQQTISRVALFYLRRAGYRQEVPVRFDVVAVSGTDELDVHLYQNAFEFCGL
jgi:putative endonuclease